MSVFFPNPPAIQIMNDFRVNNIVFPRSPKTRRLFALLALHAGEFIAMPQLTNELWGEHKIRKPDAALYVLISNIRMAINRTFVIEHGEAKSYRLVVERDEVDVLRFMRLVDLALAAERAENFREVAEYTREALGLTDKTEFLSELLPTPMLEEWRRRVRSQTRTALLCWADANLRLGLVATVLDRLYKAWCVTPTLQDLALRLMIALYVLARSEESLRVFTMTRYAVHNNLNTKPHPALVRAQIAIMCGEKPDVLLGLLPSAR